MSDTYYDKISSGYDELHEQEQLKKLSIIKKELQITKTTNLLDVGCGTGISSHFDCYVTGIDSSEGLLEIARRKFTDKDFVKADAEKIPFQNNSFDIVVSLTAIQNFNDIEKGLNEIKRVGKEKFALSFLKKSSKAMEIEDKINKIFKEFKIKRIEEEKDVIFVIEN
ncbi:methyltransferase domain-containing protein [Candidatus Woesearchaeota archaeon]|nr:methyltransferase domain-containing protein [Candidatus Woesearchaeota archaeon]